MHETICFQPFLKLFLLSLHPLSCACIVDMCSEIGTELEQKNWNWISVACAWLFTCSFVVVFNIDFPSMCFL